MALQTRHGRDRAGGRHETAATRGPFRRGSRAVGCTARRAAAPGRATAGAGLGPVLGRLIRVDDRAVRLRLRRRRRHARRDLRRRPGRARGHRHARAAEPDLSGSGGPAAARHDRRAGGARRAGRCCGRPSRTTRGRPHARVDLRVNDGDVPTGPGHRVAVARAYTGGADRCERRRDHVGEHRRTRGAGPRRCDARGVGRGHRTRRRRRLPRRRVPRAVAAAGARARAGRRRATSRRPLRDVAAGAASLARIARPAGYAVLAFAQTFVRGALLVLIVVVALDVLSLGSGAVGWLNAAIGAGGLVGGALAARLARLSRLGRCVRAGRGPVGFAARGARRDLDGGRRLSRAGHRRSRQRGRGCGRVHLATAPASATGTQRPRWARFELVAFAGLCAGSAAAPAISTGWDPAAR